VDTQHYRIDHDMTWHDANIKKFSQWFKRAMRGGYAYAEAVYMYRTNPRGYWRKNLLRGLFWGLLWPSTIASLTYFNPIFVFLLLSYPLQVIRITLKSKSKDLALIYGLFMVIAKFPEALGALKFALNNILSIRPKIIEYK